MLKSHRSDVISPITTTLQTPRRILCGAALCAAMVLVLLSPTPVLAQKAQPQRAIEKLEGCSREERSSGCVNILASKPAGENRKAIKAQIRGGRIIWYEYNTRTGQVRRTN